MPKGDKPNLTSEQCKALIANLLDDSFIVGDERRLVKGAARHATIKFKMSEQNVRRLFKKAKER